MLLYIPHFDEDKSMRYFLAFLIALLLIFWLIFLIFRGGNNKPKVPSTTKALTSYASTNAEVRMTIDGPINAAQIHQQVRITAGRDDVTYEELKGYNGDVVNQRHFSNTQEAYAVFLSALNHAGFTQGTKDPVLKDERGYCSLGDRYIFELIQSGQDIFRYWATSCGNPKTYLGALTLTISLFKAQVPNYTDLTQNVRL